MKYALAVLWFLSLVGIAEAWTHGSGMFNALSDAAGTSVLTDASGNPIGH